MLSLSCDLHPVSFWMAAYAHLVPPLHVRSDKLPSPEVSSPCRLRQHLPSFLTFEWVCRKYLISFSSVISSSLIPPGSRACFCLADQHVTCSPCPLP